MFAKLALLFIIIPIIELSLLIKLGQIIDFWPTVALIITTGLIGATLAKRQGRAAWARIQDAMRQGRLPSDELLDGVLVLVAGVVLITPGLLTDVTGMLLMLPPIRRWVGGFIKKRFKANAHTFVAGQVHHHMGGSPFGGGPLGGAPFRDEGKGPIIDVTPEGSDSAIDV